MPTINPGSHDQKSLSECQEKTVVQQLNSDPPPEYCGPHRPPSCDGDSESGLDANKRSVGSTRPDLGWLQDVSGKKTGFGAQALCDPMQSGKIVNDLENPNRNVINRYSNALRGADEAMKDMFNDMSVIDEEGKAHKIPIIWGTQEKAVAAILQPNVRKDNSLVVDRIMLPALSIYQSDIQMNQQRYTYHKAIDFMRSSRPDWKPGFTIKERFERDTVFGVARGIPVDISYTLTAWTWYIEDMNQIVEQVLLKFSPIAYIRVRGVSWETGVKIDSIANNLDTEPGDQNVRVIKFVFNMTAETYIPQPIRREKAVLRMKTDIFNSIEPTEITDVLARLEEAVEELE